MEGSGIKGLAVALAVHCAALGALFLMGAASGNDTTASDADPILLMLPGNDDPTKDAGLVGNERGPARGTKDGNLFDPGKYTEEHLEDIAEADKKAAEAAAEAARVQAEKEAAAAEQAREREQAPKSVPVAPKKTDKNVAKNPSKKTPEKKPSAAKSDGNGKRENRQLVSTKDIINKRGNGRSSPASSKNSTKGTGRGISGVSVDTKEIFGTGTGTGGNGGDGGSRVADARQVYVKAVDKVLKPHFENVIAQNPVSISQDVVVSVRFSVDARGNIKFLEVIGSSDPQIRDRLQKAFSRAFPGKYQIPPNGDPFTGMLNGITFARQ